MVNLNQLGKSVLMYRMDHEEACPADLKALTTGGYLRDMRICVCPASGSVPGDAKTVDEWSDYVLVPADADAPPGTVLAFERPGCHRGRGGNVLYVDGRVEWLQADEFEEATQGRASP